MAVLALLAIAGWARAERVALVRPAEGDAVLVEAFNRLTAELRLQNFDVAIADVRGDPRSAEVLELVARRADAAASVAVVRDESGIVVQVWLDDRASGKPTLRKVQSTAGSELPSVLAIRAVDLLRASLRESNGDLPREAARASPPLPDVSSAPLPPVRPWELRGEALMIFDGPNVGSVFGAATRASPAASITWAPTPARERPSWRRPLTCGAPPARSVWMEVSVSLRTRDSDFRCAQSRYRQGRALV